MRRLIVRFRPFAGYILVFTIISIMVVSSIPSVPTLKIHTAKSDIRLDYFIHFCEYGFLAFIAFLTFTGKDFTTPFKSFILIALGLVIFAVIDEFHQKFIPGRTFNPKDLMSNVGGIIFAVIFSVIVFRQIAAERNIQ